MGWWFGRILTFEVVADEEAPALSAILDDASGGLIDCDAAAAINGFAAYGRTIKSALEPLVDCFAVELCDDGMHLRSPSGTPLLVSEADFGSSADGEQTPKLQREQIPASTLPAVLRLSYYDPSRDFQAGEARASAGEADGTEEQRDLPAVLDAGAAKSLCQRLLARQWAARDRLTLRLPPRYAALKPGSRLILPTSPAGWTVVQSSLDAFVAVTELRPSWEATATLPAAAGQVLKTMAAGIDEVAVSLFKLPAGMEDGAPQPTLVLAASSPSLGWKRSVVEIRAGRRTMCVLTPRRKSLLGQALTALGPVDEDSSVDVELIDADQWLTSCDQEDLATGTNLAILGEEVIQFGDALPIGPGRFRLARLVRGRGRTNGTIADHVIGEKFLLLERASISPVAVEPWMNGSSVTAVAVASRSPHRKSTAILARRHEIQIPAPEGGTIVDTQARSAIDQILAAMRARGLIHV